MVGRGRVDEPRDERAEDATEAGADRENGDDGDDGENVVRKRQTRFVNGIPLDANGRPVGVLATFPDPRYAAVDREGSALPLEARREFIPKPMPPAKRAYHPQAAPFGPARDGGGRPGGEPVGHGPARPGRGGAGQRPMPKPAPGPDPGAVQARLRESGVGAVSEADARELFRAALDAAGREGAEIEAFADAVLLAPQRGPESRRPRRVRANAFRFRGKSRITLFVGKITYAPCRPACCAARLGRRQRARLREAAGRPRRAALGARLLGGRGRALLAARRLSASARKLQAVGRAPPTAGQPDSRT